MSSWIYDKIIEGLLADGFNASMFFQLTQKQAKLYFIDGLIRNKPHKAMYNTQYNSLSGEILCGINQIEEMPRYFAPITIEELEEKISKFERFYELRDSLKKDIKVQFDFENFSDDDTFGPEGLMGYQILENGLTYWGMAAGGDWEHPVFFIIYWDGKKLRGYVPTEGNPWNTTTKQAYGNDEVADTKNAKKRWPDSYGHLEKGEYVDSCDFDFSPELIKKDILERILKPGSPELIKALDSIMKHKPEKFVVDNSDIKNKICDIIMDSNVGGASLHQMIAIVKAEAILALFQGK